MLKIADTLSKSQKIDLDVLENGETRRERLWHECIKEAKLHLKHSDELRFKIISLAEKCCYDGQGSKYTYARFAGEIGLASTTLYEWIKVKKDVYDVIPKADQSFLSFNQMRDLNSRTTGLKSNEKGKAVLRALKQLKEESPDTLKFRKYLGLMKNVLFNAKDKNRVKDCDREVLVEILHVSRAISKNLSWVDYEVRDRK